MQPHMIIDDATDPDDCDLRYLASVIPARAEDATELLARPMGGNDNRSEWVWVRLRDGTLMLATFPQGGTYEEFSEAGVCDWGAEPVRGAQALNDTNERIFEAVQSLREKHGCAVCVIAPEDIICLTEDDDGQPTVTYEQAEAWLQLHRNDVECAIMGDYWSDSVRAVLENAPIKGEVEPCT